MDRVNKILNNSEYQSYLDTINANEKDRIYCKHGLDHLLSVARIMYIEALEKGIKLDREVIYAAALLHDIGRSVSNENHDIESAKIAVHILGLCDFSDKEIDMIKEAILNHRKGGDSEVLSALLYRADKISRDCMRCASQDTCKWKVKNKEIIR